jgi:flavorubredoxin
VLAPERLRYVAFSHVEGDECGSLREWLAQAPNAEPVCSDIAAMIYANDATDGSVRALADGTTLDLGGHVVTWFYTPHVPHGWECGYLWESTTRTLLCGDLFTQAGAENPPLTTSEIVGRSEAMRARVDYFAHSPNTHHDIERLAALEPRVLACMHGSAFEGDGRAQLLALASAVKYRI